jgi:hypothetical protein
MLKVVGTEATQEEVDGRSLLDEIAREGARRMLVPARPVRVSGVSGPRRGKGPSCSLHAAYLPFDRLITTCIAPSRLRSLLREGDHLVFEWELLLVTPCLRGPDLGGRSGCDVVERVGDRACRGERREHIG